MKNEQMCQRKSSKRDQVLCAIPKHEYAFDTEPVIFSFTMAIPTLPELTNELLFAIIAELDSLDSFRAFSRTCRHFKSLADSCTGTLCLNIFLGDIGDLQTYACALYHLQNSLKWQGPLRNSDITKNALKKLTKKDKEYTSIPKNLSNEQGKVILSSLIYNHRVVTDLTKRFCKDSLQKNPLTQEIDENPVEPSPHELCTIKKGFYCYWFIVLSFTTLYHPTETRTFKSGTVRRVTDRIDFRTHLVPFLNSLPYWKYEVINAIREYIDDKMKPYTVAYHDDPMSDQRYKVYMWLKPRPQDWDYHPGYANVVLLNLQFSGVRTLLDLDPTSEEAKNIMNEKFMIGNLYNGNFREYALNGKYMVGRLPGPMRLWKDDSGDFIENSSWWTNDQHLDVYKCMWDDCRLKSWGYRRESFVLEIDANGEEKSRSRRYSPPVQSQRR